MSRQQARTLRAAKSLWVCHRNSIQSMKQLPFYWLPRFFCQSALNGPTKYVYACGNGPSSNPCNPTPLLQGHRLVTKSDNSVVASVILLINHQSPFAIGQFIIAVIINPFYRMFFGWRKSHIFQKIFKYFPSFAYLNASGTVRFPPRCAGGRTPSNHVAPFVMNASSRPSMSCAIAIGVGTYW